MTITDTAVREPMIRVEGLRKEYPARGKAALVVALGSVSFEVQPGEVFGLLGPNGAGKSTTVQLLSTLMRPTGGTVRIAGYDIVEDAEQVRSRIGVALQDTALAEMMTAREALRHAGQLWGMSHKEAAARAVELLALVDLEEAADRLIKTYSGGMQRRLDLALALVHRPPVLYLDEPTNGLDPVSRRALWEQIRALRDSGTTILLTTQYLEEADQLADRVAIIDGGEVIALGSPEELKRNHSGDTVEVLFADRAEAARAAQEVQAGGIPGAQAGQLVRYRVQDAAAAVPALMADLSRVGIQPRETTIKRPTLDDVFIALTGHGITTSDDDQEDPDPGTETRSVEQKKVLPQVAPAAKGPGAASVLTQTRLLFARLFREALRNPAASLPNLMIGTFFLFVYDGLLGGSAAVQEVPGGNYTNFLLPIILLFTSLSGGVAGMTLVQDIEAGHFRRQLTMPLSRTALMASFMLLGALVVLVQAIIVTLLSLLIGLDPATGVLGMLVVFALSLLWGLGIAGYSAATAMITGNAAAANAATLIFFPLLFISPALMPQEQLKGWIAVAAHANPATYLLDAMRGLLTTGWDSRSLAIGFAVGAGFALVMLLWASIAAKRATSRA
ncbi:ATP-binding cassette domain-containing protein [Micromonospora sp. NPDC047134]|uniref:ABC transporter ATP-binding protein/permease n=1 Tax=Micromonospora sp. NPDC047134 TaxID=3154340 RepID=UPI0033CD7745